MIIGLSGLISSGKGTVSDYLIKHHNFTQMSFAGSLKDAVAMIFGWDRALLEGDTEESRIWREKIDLWWSKRLDIPHLTPRWVLQYFGTDVCRNNFSNDIWLASLENKLIQFKDKNIVISDVRFLNELALLKNLGALTLCVKRGDLPNWWHIARLAHSDVKMFEMMQSLNIHPSEWDWASHNFDIVISNNSSLQDLYGTVDTILKGQGIV